MTDSPDELLGGSRRLDERLAAWVAEVRIDEAARRRLRTEWLSRQASEEATLAGVLVDLAERGTRAVLETAGRRFAGDVVGVATDFAALAGPGATVTLVPFRSLDRVRAEPGAPAVRGDRAVAVAVRFADVLGPVAADRPDVVVHHAGNEPITGVLRSAGDGLLVIASGEPPVAVYASSETLTALVIR